MRPRLLWGARILGSEWSPPRTLLSTHLLQSKMATTKLWHPGIYDLKITTGISSKKTLEEFVVTLLIFLCKHYYIEVTFDIHTEYHLLLERFPLTRNKSLKLTIDCKNISSQTKRFGSKSKNGPLTSLLEMLDYILNHFHRKIIIH